MATPDIDSLNSSIQDLTGIIKDLGKSMSAAAVGVDKAGSAYTYFNSRFKRDVRDVEDEFNSFDKALKSGRVNIGQSTQSIVSLRESLEELDDAVLDEADKKRKRALQEQVEQRARQAKSSAADKFLLDSLGTVATSVASWGVNVTKSLINSTQSNADAFSTFGDVAKVGADSTNQVVQGVTTAGAALATTMALLAPETAGLSLAVAALLPVVGGLFNSFTELKKAGIDAAVREIQRTTKAFSGAANAGIVFTDSFMGLRQGSLDAGLTLEQFSKAVTENAEGLSQFGGTATQGVSAFKQVSRILMAPDGAIKQLLKLGYSIDDVADGTAKFLGMYGTYERKQSTDYANLAEQTAKYLENTRLISAITGENAKAAQEQAKKLTIQAAVDAKLRAAGPDAFLKFQYYLSTLAPSAREAAAEMYGLGAVTGENAKLVSQSDDLYAALNEGIAVVNDTNIKSGDSARMLIDINQKHAGAIREQFGLTEQSIGQAAMVNSAYGQQAAGIQNNIEFYTKLEKADPAETMARMLKSVETAGGATEEYAKTVLENQKTQLEVQKTLNQVLTDFQGFHNVAKTILEQTGKILKEAGFKAVPGGGGGAGGGGTPPVGRGQGTQAAAQAQIEGAKNAVKGFFGGTQNAGRGRGYVPGAPATGVDPTIPAGLGVNGRQGSGKISQSLQDKLNKLAADPMFAGSTITALNDSDIFDAHKSPDPHGRGLGIDFKIPGYKPEQTADYKAELSKLGFTNILDEYITKSKNNTGDHMHAEVSAADGAMVSGPSSGYPARLHGNEMIIPLDKNTIFNSMLDKLEEMIDVMKDQHSTSEKILHASS